MNPGIFNLSNIDIVIEIVLLDIEKEYRKRGEYRDGIVEIFDTLAAYALYQGQNSDGPEDKGRREEIQDHLAKSEAVKAVNEYTIIIRGFDALYSGMMVFNV